MSRCPVRLPAGFCGSAAHVAFTAGALNPTIARDANLLVVAAVGLVARGNVSDGRATSRRRHDCSQRPTEHLTVERFQGKSR
jgi:hypothetical protein